MTEKNLEILSLAELKKLAKEYGIKGISSLNKSKLIDVLENYEGDEKLSKETEGELIRPMKKIIKKRKNSLTQKQKEMHTVFLKFFLKAMDFCVLQRFMQVRRIFL